jgi:thioredoxin 1
MTGRIFTGRGMAGKAAKIPPQPKETTMPMTHDFAAPEPRREEIDALTAPTLLEFGADWCGHCQAAQPLLTQAFANFPQVQHLKIADGPGRPLGRSFRVKLWPTLIFLRQGQEVARLVRPGTAADIAAQLAAING